MGRARERYDRWIRDHLRKRYPELEHPLLAVVDGFDAIQANAIIDAGDLRPIVEAASSQRRPLLENATTLLSELTERYEEARGAVAAMSEDSRNHVRFNAILCLGSPTPLAFTLGILRRSLRDKSARVREKAADWAGRLRLREFVPDLESAFSIEQNSKAKRTIEFELKLLRDGYILEPRREGFFVTTHRSGGGVTAQFVPHAELEQRGIDAIVADMTERKSFR
jgi:hypothetical protein